MIDRVRLWIRSIVLRRRLEREMQEEMAAHLERAADRLMARGLSAEAARRAAAKEFGNVAYIQEQARDARGAQWVDALATDARFAMRQFRRRLGTTITMLAVLVLGLSVSAALFSFVNAYATQPPPGIRRADGLVRIRGSQTFPSGRVGRSFSSMELQEYQKLAAVFSAVAGWTNDAITVDVAGDDERRALSGSASFVTADFFEVLGVRPILGAGLRKAESAGSATHPVAIIGHTAWDRLFGRSPGVLGATLSVNGVSVTVVGVAPPRFVGVNRPEALKLWMPLPDRRLIVRDRPAEAEDFGAAARLRPGVSLRAATSAVQVVAARAAASREMPVLSRGQPRRFEMEPSADVVSLLAMSGDPNFERDLRLLTVAFAGLALLILLVTCTNVSALLTGLAMARRHEISMRLSLGAARTRIIRQLLTESVLLATAAGALALGVVWIVERATLRLPEFPFVTAVSWPAVVFTFAIALAVGVLFGLSPALHAVRSTVANTLKDSTSTIAASRARLQRGLVVAQIAFTQPMIVAVAALLVLLLGEHQRRGLNESADQIVRLHLGAPSWTAATPQEDPELLQRRRREMHRLLDRLERTSGVVAAAPDVRDALALDGYSVHPEDRIEGGLESPLQMSAPLVSPSYFDVMGIPLVLGRAFAPTDTIMDAHPASAALPVVIGGDLARRLWPGANPIGRRLRPPADALAGERTLFVVGVVDQRVEEEDRHRVYLPPNAAPREPSSRSVQYHTHIVGGLDRVWIRVAGDAQRMIPTIRRIVHDELPGRAIGDARTLAEIEAEARKSFYFAAAALSVGGLIALTLSAIGLYAVVAFAVGQRTGEIAVRMVVGARPQQIVRSFIGSGLRLGVLGLVLGLPLSMIGLRIVLAVPDFLPAIAVEPVAALAVLGILVVAAAASSIPAGRAATVDPARTLRAE